MAHIIKMLEKKRDSLEKQIENRIDDLLWDIERAQKYTNEPPALIIARKLNNYRDVAELIGEYDAYVDVTAIAKSEVEAWEDEIEKVKGGTK